MVQLVNSREHKMPFISDIVTTSERKKEWSADGFKTVNRCLKYEYPRRCEMSINIVAEGPKVPGIWGNEGPGIWRFLKYYEDLEFEEIWGYLRSRVSKKPGGQGIWSTGFGGLIHSEKIWGSTIRRVWWPGNLRTNLGDPKGFGIRGQGAQGLVGEGSGEWEPLPSTMGFPGAGSRSIFLVLDFISFRWLYKYLSILIYSGHVRARHNTAQNLKSTWRFVDSLVFTSHTLLKPEGL